MSYPIIYVILYINYISIKSTLFLSILKRIGKITYLLVGRYIPTVWVHSANYRLTLKRFTSRTSGLNDTSLVGVRDFGTEGQQETELHFRGFLCLCVSCYPCAIWP